jgi:tetratricopeptide (TPR) repeat protein
MKASESKLCPSCGLRNKPKWEFCARCGESLQEVDVGGASASEAADAPGPSWGSSEALNWLGFGLALLVSLMVLVRWRPSPAEADPAIFVAPRADPAPSADLVDMSAPTPPPGVQDGLAALRAGDPKAALAALAQAAAAAPNDPSTRYAYAQALWVAGQKEGAIEQYRAAVRLSPETVNYHRDLAKALVAAGRPTEAIPEYEAALQIQPHSPGYLQELSALYVQTGNSQGAIDLLTRAVALKGGDPQLLQDLGQALERSGDKSAAADVYRRIMEANPADATARALLSEIVFGEGRQEEAIALVRQGIGAGGPAPLYRALASLLERNGRTQEAADTYREYAQRAASAPDAEAMAERARILEQSGRS